MPPKYFFKDKIDKRLEPKWAIATRPNGEFVVMDDPHEHLDDEVEHFVISACIDISWKIRIDDIKGSVLGRKPSSRAAKFFRDVFMPEVIREIPKEMAKKYWPVVYLCSGSMMWFLQKYRGQEPDIDELIDD